MLDTLDTIVGFIDGQPWTALGAALVCLIIISAALAAIERRASRKQLLDDRQRKEQELRSRDA